MPRLIHLNGLSRVGKSSLARRYGDDHPGTLVLDIDVLVGLIGGWRKDFFGVLGTARGHGRALAQRHLSHGGDVVLPQLVTSHDRDLGFDDVAGRQAPTIWSSCSVRTLERIANGSSRNSRPTTSRLTSKRC